MNKSFNSTHVVLLILAVIIPLLSAILFTLRFNISDFNNTTLETPLEVVSEKSVPEVEVPTDALSVSVQVIPAEEIATDDTPAVVVPTDWEKYTSPEGDISFALPTNHLVSFENEHISMPIGPEDYFSLTTFRLQRGATALDAFRDGRIFGAADSEIVSFVHTIYDHITVFDVPGKSMGPDGISYTHRIYAVSVPNTDKHYFFTGWEDWSLSSWEHIVPFLGSISVN